MNCRMWMSDYGAFAMPPSAIERLRNVRFKKNGDLDYRFKAARRLRLTLNYVALKRYLRNDG